MGFQWDEDSSSYLPRIVCRESHGSILCLPSVLCWTLVLGWVLVCWKFDSLFPCRHDWQYMIVIYHQTRKQLSFEVFESLCLYFLFVISYNVNELPILQVLFSVYSWYAGYVWSYSCKTTNEEHVRNQENDTGLKFTISTLLGYLIQLNCRVLIHI